MREPHRRCYKEVSVAKDTVHLPSDSMRALVLLVCLSAGCLAQRPKKCTSPPLLTGELSVSTASEKLMAYARYSYDALEERVHITDFGSYNNKSFHHDLLLLYKERVMYLINKRNRTCCKRPLNADFHPLMVPEGASLQAQVVLGSSSGPRQGLLVNTWTGEMRLKEGTAKYMSTVTEFGCIPVSTLLHTDSRGWMAISFFNNVIGLVDPQGLNPPPFCKGAQLEEENPATFFSLF